MRQIRKKILSFMAAALVLAGCVQCAYAESAGAGNWPVDLDRKGSFSVALKAGGDINLYKVADVVVDDGYKFALTKEFAKAAGSRAQSVTKQINSQDEIGSASLASTIAGLVSASGAKAQTKKASSDTTVKFENLSVGLYLATQTKASSGYNKLDPFLISLPGENQTYDVTALPKPDLTPKTGDTGVPNKGTPPSGSRLPQTGQLWWPVWMLSLAGAVLVAAGLLTKKRAGRN